MIQFPVLATSLPFLLQLSSPSLKSLKFRKQSPDTGLTVVSSRNVSVGVTASQTQGTLQHPRPVLIFEAIQQYIRLSKLLRMTEGGLVLNTTGIGPEVILNNHTLSVGYSHRVQGPIDPLPLSPSSSTDDTPASSTSISVKVGGGTINPNAHSHSLEPVRTFAESSSTAPTPGINTSTLDLQNPEGKATLPYSASSTISPLAIENQLGLKPGTETITASSKSQIIFDYSQTLYSGSETPSATSAVQPLSSKTTPANGPSISTGDTKATGPPTLAIGSPTVEPIETNRSILGNGQALNTGSTNTLGSSISTKTLGTQIPGYPNPLVSASSTSQISHAAVTPALPEIPTTPADGGNALTTNSLGHSSIGNHILLPGSAVTASGTMISLTPNQSDVVVGTHTGGLGTNFTGGLASGPKATGAQTFKGDALGMRNDLCGSSMVMLVGISILLWLR